MNDDLEIVRFFASLIAHGISYGDLCDAVAIVSVACLPPPLPFPIHVVDVVPGGLVYLYRTMVLGVPRLEVCVVDGGNGTFTGINGA